MGRIGKVPEINKSHLAVKLFVLISLFIIVNSSFGQNLSKEVDSIYNFKPKELSDRERENKSPILDKFWDEIKSDTSKYLPQLRFELKTSEHNPFFYYDGSSLLLSLSNTNSDKELAVSGISKCDLDDISQKIFVSTLNKLAQDGIDVTPAAVKILNDDKFSFLIPEHAMLFDQRYCLTYMLLPQKNLQYVDTLISMFPKLSLTSQKSIITTLWFAYSCKGDSFLRSVITDPSAKKEISEYAKKIISRGKITKAQQDYLKTINRNDLKEMRTIALQRFSDEAIGELEMITTIMRSETNCY